MHLHGMISGEFRIATSIENLTAPEIYHNETRNKKKATAIAGGIDDVCGAFLGNGISKYT